MVCVYIMHPWRVAKDPKMNQVVKVDDCLVKYANCACFRIVLEHLLTAARLIFGEETSDGVDYSFGEKAN